MISKFWDRDGSVIVTKATINGLAVNTFNHPSFAKFKNSLFYPNNHMLTQPVIHFSFELNNDPNYITLNDDDNLVMKELIRDKLAIVWFKNDFWRNHYEGLILDVSHIPTPQLIDSLIPSVKVYEVFDLEYAACRLDLNDTSQHCFIADNLLFDIFKKQFLKVIDDLDLKAVKEVAPFNFQIVRTSNSQRIFDKIS